MFHLYICSFYTGCVSIKKLFLDPFLYVLLISGDECSMINMFKCYGDILKGVGIDSIDSPEDISKAMTLHMLDPKDIDHRKFCK